MGAARKKSKDDRTSSQTPTDPYQKFCAKKARSHPDSPPVVGRDPEAGGGSVGQGDGATRDWEADLIPKRERDFLSKVGRKKVYGKAEQAKHEIGQGFNANSGSPRASGRHLVDSTNLRKGGGQKRGRNLDSYERDE